MCLILTDVSEKVVDLSSCKEKLTNSRVANRVMDSSEKIGIVLGVGEVEESFSSVAELLHVYLNSNEYMDCANLIYLSALLQ